MIELESEPLFQHTAARRRLPSTSSSGWASKRVSTHSRPKAAACKAARKRRGCWFQHTAARRRLPDKTIQQQNGRLFQHTAARRRLLRARVAPALASVFQHTAARRRLRLARTPPRTHVCFNTQPPEGGCVRLTSAAMLSSLFQHTAARRRLPQKLRSALLVCVCFNTQPPEGGCRPMPCRRPARCRFNTQPPEGGCQKPAPARMSMRVSTHSRPKAAAPILRPTVRKDQFQHTAARRRLLRQPPDVGHWDAFQHTAARRRLRSGYGKRVAYLAVSTHSRPKAAALRIRQAGGIPGRFNTQPPEGGCVRP